MIAKEFIMVVGAESTGHHLLRDLLQDFLSKKNVMNINEISHGKTTQKFRDYFLNIGNPIPHPRKKEKQRTVQFIDIEILKKGIMEELESFNQEILYFDGSLPYGYRDRILSFPNYVKFHEMFNNILDFKLIYLTRNITDCAKSIFRRGFETNPLSACEIALKSFAVADYTFQKFKNEMSFVEINYDKITSGNLESFSNLQSILKLEKNFFEKKYPTIKKKDHSSNSSGPQSTGMKLIEEYLSYYSFFRKNV